MYYYHQHYHYASNTTITRGRIGVKMHANNNPSLALLSRSSTAAPRCMLHLQLATQLRTPDQKRAPSDTAPNPRPTAKREPSTTQLQPQTYSQKRALKDTAPNPRPKAKREPSTTQLRTPDLQPKESLGRLCRAIL